MAQSEYFTAQLELPTELPIFPLTHAVLLPECTLPLRIFEPRYLAMVGDVMKGNRLIGMIQPSEEEGKLFDVGCAGRITAFQETDNGEMLITLSGVCRFRVDKELPSKDGYRRVKADWIPFLHDMEKEVEANGLHSSDIVSLLDPLFTANGLRAEWRDVDQLSGDMLLDLLVMNLPLPPADKQALLEAPDAVSRYQLMQTMVQIYTAGAGGSSQTLH